MPTCVYGLSGVRRLGENGPEKIRMTIPDYRDKVVPLDIYMNALPGSPMRKTLVLSILAGVDESSIIINVRR